VFLPQDWKNRGWWRQRLLGFHEPERTLRTSRDSYQAACGGKIIMNRRFIRRTSGGSRMRYARRRLDRKVQESRKQDGATMKRVPGLKGAETFMAEESAGHEFVPLYEIAAVRKEIRKHPPGGDVL